MRNLMRTSRAPHARLDRKAVLLLATLEIGLSGCATTRQPTAPTVMVLPAPGESFTVFQQHDITCRQYAATQTGGQTPGQAAARSEVAGAAAGAGVGAAAGALFGSANGRAGNGAAIGAGSGLLAGGLLGIASGRAAATSLQNRYNMSYTQCMIANGDRLQQPARTVVYRPAPPPVIYAPAPAYLVPVPRPFP